ncbi:uncharacterized protein N7473_008147 [Penicillium subrubescens]|uniref:DUF6594 domain-containing protein n=1 Tax=Penicillium subrubescens TaxID=1316194 RepID=A0A1Q5TF53_9EURO|nr:uncharacterized protein N7473_008147 [Penicillium subrubescens]KAJ5891919.1 hypothetical protein N7473_008147 [Penicillium subrubescens]OKO98857.1 hypothetical protein PENSUB_8774 [Penicillium subrubescens]
MHSLRSRKPQKQGRKRTSSTVSNATTVTQAGPGQSPKITNKPSSPNDQFNASKQALKPLPALESPPDKPLEPARKVPNVFEFLEEGDSTSSSPSSSELESSEDDEPAPPVHAQAIAKIQSPKPRSSPIPHSLLVSQKPLPSTTISRSSSDSRPPPPAPTAPAPSERQVQITRRQVPSRKASPTEPPSPGKHELQITRPESYYTSRDATTIHRPPLPPSPPSSPEDSLHRGTALKRRDSSAPEVTSGYGLVASHLTHSTTQDKAAFPPLYRRFESVNHRVLLHLQDEISQMEEDLHTLDEYEEMHRVATAEKEGTKPLPASRRVDVQSQAYSSLHYRRMDLMAALVQKTEQYNTALSAYSKVLQTLPRASDDDITNYRSWMKEHNPIAAAETRFLDQDADLVALTPRLAASAAAAPVYMAIIIASGALLMPLLAFSMIAEFSGRLVVVTVTGGAAAAVAANYSSGIEALVDSRDGWRCATIYFGFMTIAAMFIP